MSLHDRPDQAGPLPQRVRLPAIPGHPGGVLVIADNATIGTSAIRWRDSFAASGRPYRVRLVGANAAGDIEKVVAEGRSLKAAAILVAGGDAALAVSRQAAARLGLPLAVDHAAGHAEG
jgi:glycerol dehydrogenase-like iron-containing ADH family enzyme